MMRCHTAAQTALYERGYPYFVELVDDHKDDKKPEASAAKVYKDYFGVYHVKWPRLTARAFLKLPGEVTVADAEKAIASLLAKPERDEWYATQHVVFVFEAFIGTDAMLEVIVSALEGFPEKRWGNTDGEDGAPAVLAYLTGFLLLRSKRAAAFRERLEALYARATKAAIGEGEHTIRGALDLSLHGNAGAARALAKSHWQYWYYYLMVDDAAVHVARLKDNWKSDWVPESRILYLAGEDLLPLYTSKKALRQGKRLPHILRDFGMFDHDRVFELLVDMVGVKGAGDAPRDYFRENEAYARPKLERLAKGDSASAVKAKAALATLDAR